MVRNPFIISGKIEKEYFCDRKKESSELIRLINNQNNVVLISPRRMGKTGLIRYCYEMEDIKEHYNTFFIDILQTSSLREFVYLLGKEIYSKLVPLSERMVRTFFKTLKSLTGKFAFDAITGLPTFSINLGDIDHPEMTLEEIFLYLSESELENVIAIDEFQQIAFYPEKNIEALLRSHIQKSSNCRFIFSGSRRHMIKEMFLDAARPFYNSASIIDLDAIPKEEYVLFIEEMFEKKGRKIDEGMAKKIYELFEGHTYYVQRTCNEAFSYTSKGGSCSKEILDSSINNIINSLALIYREILSQLTLKQKEVLYAIAMEVQAKDITSESFIKKYSLSSSSSVQSAMRSLITQEIILKTGTTYMIYDRFFGLWLREMLL